MSEGIGEGGGEARTKRPGNVGACIDLIGYHICAASRGGGGGGGGGGGVKANPGALNIASGGLSVNPREFSDSAEHLTAASQLSTDRYRMRLRNSPAGSLRSPDSLCAGTARTGRIIPGWSRRFPSQD
jgi:hypothetical protein